MELVNSTIADVAIKEQLTEEEIQGMVTRRVAGEVNWKAIKSLGIIGMDEIALKKGYRNFVTIITSRVNDKNTLLAILEGHKKATVKGFLKSIPVKLR
jgi:transposase